MKREDKTKGSNTTRNIVISLVAVAAIASIASLLTNRGTIGYCKSVCPEGSCNTCGLVTVGNEYDILLLEFVHLVIRIKTNGSLCTIGLARINNTDKWCKIVTPDWWTAVLCLDPPPIVTGSRRILVKGKQLTRAQVDFLNGYIHRMKDITRRNIHAKMVRLESVYKKKSAKYFGGKTMNCQNFVAEFMKHGDAEVAKIGNKLLSKDWLQRGLHSFRVTT